MLDPYRMVVVNLIACLFLILGLFFFKYKFPSKKVNHFTLLLLISTLPLMSLLRTGAYESGDFNIHIYRIMSFYDSLMEGNLMPSWASELNASYGNPLFIFNYSLPYYFVSIFHYIGFSFITSMKMYLGFSFILSGIFMYLWINKLIKNQLGAFTSAIFYLFNPYHLIDFHFRATLGESTVFTLIPLYMYFITDFFTRGKKISLVYVTLLCQLLFFAHPMMAGIFLVISVMYILFFFTRKKLYRKEVYSILALILGVIGAIYVWAPFIIFRDIVYPNPFLNYFQSIPLNQMLYSPYRYGFLFQGHNGELTPILGYTQIFVLFVTGFLLLHSKASKSIKKNLFFWIFLTTVILFLLTPYSKLIWDQFPFFYMLQGMRLLLPIALCSSVLAGVVALYFYKIKKGTFIIYLLIIITIGYTILNWGHRAVLTEVNDDNLRKNVWISTVNEGITAFFLNTKWADKDNFWFTTLPNKNLEIIEGEAEILQLSRKSLEHRYIVNAKTPLIMKENTLLYPGWSLRSNDKKINIFPGNRGVTYFKLAKGLQYLEFKYDDIGPYKISKLISAGIFIILVTIIFMHLLIRYKLFFKLVRSLFFSNP